MLARYTLVDGLDRLPALFTDWSAWCARVADWRMKYTAHTHSPGPRSHNHFAMAALAVADAAALDVAARPSAGRTDDGHQPPDDPLVGVGQLLAAAKDLKQGHPALTAGGSGYSHLQEWLPHESTDCARSAVDSAAPVRADELPKAPHFSCCGRLNPGPHALLEPGHQDAVPDDAHTPSLARHAARVVP